MSNIEKSKASNGQTILRAFPLDKSSVPVEASSRDLSMKNTGLSRSLNGAQAAGPAPGRKDKTR